MDTGELDKATYIRLTTFRRDGTAVSCPVWLALTGDATYVFTTDLDSGKAKRLRNDQRVEASVSDARGRVAAGARVYVGRGRVLEGADADAAYAAIARRHRVLGPLLALGGRIGGLVRRRPAVPRGGVELRLTGTR